MAEIAYLTGDPNDPDDHYFANAEEYFTHAFSGSPGSVVKWVNTLDGILADLATATITYDVVHIVSHGWAHGTLFFRADAAAEPYIGMSDLNIALEYWDHRFGAFCRPLWARKHAGKSPVAVGRRTIIEIDGCDIGLCPIFLEAFGRMFTHIGTVRAPVRLATFFGGATPAMSQARTMSYIDQSAMVIPATTNTTFNNKFVKAYMKRILGEPETKGHEATLNASFKPALTTLLKTAQTTSFRSRTPFVYAEPVQYEHEVVGVLTEAAARARLIKDEIAIEPIPYLPAEPHIAENAMFPVRNVVDQYKVTVKPIRMKTEDYDEATKKVVVKEVDGTLVTQSGTWVLLLVPLVDPDGVRPLTIDPTNENFYRTVVFSHRPADTSPPQH